MIRVFFSTRIGQPLGHFGSLWVTWGGGRGGHGVPDTGGDHIRGAAGAPGGGVQWDDGGDAPHRPQGRARRLPEVNPPL
eukprot:1296860-Pyramimonas_sp.AAC.1